MLVEHNKFILLKQKLESSFALMHIWMLWTLLLGVVTLPFNNIANPWGLVFFSP